MTVTNGSCGKRVRVEYTIRLRGRAARVHKSPVYGLSLDLRCEAWKLVRAEPGLSSCFERFTAKVAEDEATRDTDAIQSGADWLFGRSHHQSVNVVASVRRFMNATFSAFV